MTPPAPPLRARYIGYAKGTENHGDEALIWILRDLLAPALTVEPGMPEFDIALLGGGTLINQSPWLTDEFESALTTCGRGIVVGTGVGDCAFWGNQFDRWTPLLNACDFIGVRGPDSVALLQQHGVTRAVCVGDPYLWLRCPMQRDFLPKRLGLNFGGTNDSLWGRKTDAEWQDFLVEVLSVLKDRGWSFVWVSVWSKDAPQMARVRRQVGESSGPLLDARTQFPEAFSALAGCDVFLGEKLHACAMAAVAGIPFVAVEYQPKVRDFAASLGMSDWVVSTAERSVDVLVRRVEALRERREYVRSRMIKHRDDVRNRLEEFVRTIQAFYSSRGAP